MAVKLENVCYKDYKDINIDIVDNSINIIYDENENSILEVMSLLHKIDNGKVIIDDFIYSNQSVSKSIRKKIGYVSKFSEEMFFNLTVKKELESSLKLLDIDFDIEKLIEVMDMVDLDIDLLSRDPFSLSSGEMRKLAFASVLVYDPDIILLDEPFIALDIESKNNLFKLIKRLKEVYNKTIVILTNDIETTYKFADYVYVFKDNSIICSGSKKEVFNNLDLLIKNNINLPKTIDFVNYVYLNKNVKLRYREEVNDLLKDIYRDVR